MTSNDDLYDFVAKVVLIGDSSVGKTNILSRFIKNEFNNEVKPTLGVEFGTKIIVSNGKRIRIQIWDTAGQEKYQSITNSYYINSKGVLAVYDITRQSSFNNIDKWIKDVREVAGKDINIMIVGNKTDISEKREVSIEEATSKARRLDTKYIETSALNNNNIKESFQELVDMIYNNYLSIAALQDSEEDEFSGDEKDDPIIISKDNNQSDKKEGCC
jgi:small GTP-binding protein